jgi:hypothetical protein
VGTHGSYGTGRFQGTASGNTLTGAITNSYGTYDGAVFTMSADGSITGSYQFGAYERRTDLLLSKWLDYSEIPVKYESDSAISWTGLWHISSYSYGAVMMAQTGDTVKGYLGYNGLFEGTVSGSTLTAHFLPDQRVGSHITYVFTMSADGKAVSAHNYSGNSTSDTHAGTRISPITYVPGEISAPPPTPGSGDNAIVGRYTSNRGTWFDPVTGEQISRGSASSIALWVCIEFRADGTYAEYATMERSHTWADTDVSTSWEHGNYSVVDGTVVLVNIIQTRHFLVETDRNYDNRPMDDVTKTLEIDEFGLRLNGLRYFRFED